MSTQKRRIPKALTTDQLAQAQSCIFQIGPGNYEVSKILGPHWASVGTVAVYGGMFSASVSAGLLKNIRYHSKTRSNHKVYTVFG